MLMRFLFILFLCTGFQLYGFQSNYEDLITKAEASRNNGKFITAANYYKKAIPLYRKKDSLDTKAINYLNISQLYMLCRAVDSGLFYMNKAKSIIQPTSSLTARTFYNQRQASYFYTYGNIEDASTYALKALELSKQDTTGQSTMIATNSMGKIFFRTKDYEKSQFYFDASHKAAVEAKDSIKIALSLFHLGQLAIEKKEYQKAENVLENALEIYTRYDAKYGLFLIKSTLIKLYMLTSRFKDATSKGPEVIALLATFEFTNDIKDKITFAEKLQSDVAREDSLYLTKNEENAIIAAFDSLYDYKDPLNAKNEAIIASSAILEMLKDTIAIHKANLEEQKNILTASKKLPKDFVIRLLQDRLMIQDSLYQAMLKYKHIQNEKIYQTKEKDEEILILQKKTAEQDLIVAQESRQKLMLIFVLILSLLALLFISLYFKDRRKKLINKSLLEKIEARKVERSMIGDNLHDEKAKLLSEIAVSLKNKGESSTASEIEQIVNGIRDLSHKLKFISFDESSFKDQVLNTSSKYQSTSFNVHIDGLKSINWKEIQDIIKYHLLLVIKEGIHNTYNHAETNAVFITLKKELNRINLEIKDHGKGFSLTKSPNGIGLQNIKSRIQEMKGNITIQSTLGSGTIISLSTPLQLQS